MNVNVGCGTHLAKKPWVNVDLHYDVAAGITPDVVASLTELPFGDGEVRKLYAGHCLEHLSIHNPWHDPVTLEIHPSTFDRAMAEVKRVLGAEGVAAFVCPDVYRAITQYREGRADWALVDACLEGPDNGIDPASAWDGCFHTWNCHEQRLLGLIRRTFPDAIAVPMHSPALDPFPVVARADWQCAVITRP